MIRRQGWRLTLQEVGLPVLTRAVAGALVAFTILAMAAVFVWRVQQRDLIDTQRAINREQQARIADVCQAVARSDERLAFAMEALIEVSSAPPEVVEEFRRRARLEELRRPPPQCERTAQPLPRLRLPDRVP